MTIDLENEYIQELIKAYKKGLKIYYEACEDTLENIKEATDGELIIDMMNDAIAYMDHKMKAKLLYKKYNESKKEAHQH